MITVGWLIVVGFVVMAVAMMSGPPTIVRAAVVGAGFGMLVAALVVKENP